MYPFKAMAFWIQKDKNGTNIPYMAGRCCNLSKFGKGKTARHCSIIKQWEIINGKYYCVPANTVFKKIIALAITKACSAKIPVGKEVPNPNILTNHVLTLTERVGGWPKSFMAEDHLRDKGTMLSLFKRKKKSSNTIPACKKKWIHKS